MPAPSSSVRLAVLGTKIERAKKPSVSAPLRGLFFAGCDAGGYGVGTQQATESGIKVAEVVEKYHATGAR